MNIYVVLRTDDVGFDESDGCVVAAIHVSDAIALAKTLRGDQDPSVWDHASVQQVGPAITGAEEHIILSSFCAG